MRTVLFWDIDGTLLTTARAGILAVQDAVTEVCGVPCDMDGVATAGLTDHEVMGLAVRTAGGTADEPTVSAVLAAYERGLPEALQRRQGRVLPGVREILEDVSGRNDVVALLLTGNTRTGARAKLAHYGLRDFFDDGAFCAGPGPREAIAQEAAALAKCVLGKVPPPEALVVVGDTPQDIRCGAAIGARTVAVATGSYSARDLARHRPWSLHENLPAPADFRALVLRHAPSDAVADG